MDDTVVVLEPGEERAQKIAKAMASHTASDILRLIGDGQKTSTEISEQLSLPMNTAKYHIENLLDAGLISVASTKYSVKGREVKVYTLTNQLLIVAPRQSNVRSLLLKYASLFGIVAFGSIVVAIFSPVFRWGAGSMNGQGAAPRLAMMQEAGGIATKAAADTLAYNYSGNGEMLAVGSKGFTDFAAVSNVSPAPDVLASVTPVSTGTVPSPGSIPPDTALAFFLGGTLVIFLLLMYEVYSWKRMKGQ